VSLVFYCGRKGLTDKSRKIRWAGHVAGMRAKGNAFRISVGKPKEMKPLGRKRRGLADNIKMDLREIGWGGMDWIELTQDKYLWRALVSTVMNLRVPENVGKFFSTCTTASFSRRTHLHEVRNGLTAPASSSVNTLHPTCCTLKPLCQLRLAYSSKTK
jgi:hypothetical protein